MSSRCCPPAGRPDVRNGTRSPSFHPYAFISASPTSAPVRWLDIARSWSGDTTSIRIDVEERAGVGRQHEQVDTPVLVDRRERADQDRPANTGHTLDLLQVRAGQWLDLARTRLTPLIRRSACAPASRPPNQALMPCSSPKSTNATAIESNVNAVRARLARDSSVVDQVKTPHAAARVSAPASWPLSSCSCRVALCGSGRDAITMVLPWPASTSCSRSRICSAVA